MINIKSKMKFSLVILFVTLIKMMSANEGFLFGGWGHNQATNRIYNNADSSATGIAVNLGNRGFAQANPTAISSNTNYIA